jgi:site-specific DNA-methyltransferase (adenine-specific)
MSIKLGRLTGVVRMKLLQGDCLELMKDIPDQSVDMILCDLPYGTTDCKWDSCLPLDVLWKEYKRIIIKGGSIVLTASQPFTSVLVCSNIKNFKVEWVWEKNAGSNFGTVKWQPMKEHESVLVFGEGTIKYFPIMQNRASSGLSRVQRGVVNYSNNRSLTGVYSKGAFNDEFSKKCSDQRYPRSIQKFNRERGLHPTQKPVALMEYLIKTYTNEEDIVLDNCMGSGTTGIACLNLNRQFIGIEKDETYFKIAEDRIWKHCEKLCGDELQENVA